MWIWGDQCRHDVRAWRWNGEILYDAICNYGNRRYLLNKQRRLDTDTSKIRLLFCSFCPSVGRGISIPRTATKIDKNRYPSETWASAAENGPKTLRWVCGGVALAAFSPASARELRQDARRNGGARKCDWSDNRCGAVVGDGRTEPDCGERVPSPVGLTSELSVWDREAEGGGCVCV